MKKISIALIAILFMAIATLSVSAAPKSDPKIVIAPTNLSAQSTSTFEINLNWNDNSNNETNFSVERSLNAIDFVEIAELPTDTTYYSDINIENNITYYYRVRALNRVDEVQVIYSDYSNVASGIIE